MKENLLLFLSLTSMTLTAAPQTPELHRKVLSPATGVETVSSRAESESAMTDADSKTLTYLSPDPFYLKTIELIPAQKDKIAVMTRFDGTLLSRFKGNHAKTLTLAVSDEAIRTNVFILNDKGEEVFSKEISELDNLPGCDVWGVGYLWGHEVNVDVDFEITGEPFILGYEIEVAKGIEVSQIPIITQQVPTNNVSFINQYLETGIRPYYGAPYMMIHTEGDAGLADYDASLITLNPVRTIVDQDFNESGAFINLGTKPLSSILFEYENPDGSKQSYELKSDEPFGYMSTVTFAVPMKANSISSSVDCPVTISKLNGNADEVTYDNTLSANIISMAKEDAPERTVVVEIATGTWCQYCPRALASIEYLPEYTDTKHIPIEVHVSDQFEAKNVDNYKPYVNAAPGIPYAWVNRAISCDPWQGLGNDPLAYGFGELVKLIGNSLVELSVDVNGVYDPETKTITLESTTTPAIELPDGNRYKIGFALLENGLKGIQTNGYSGKATYPYPQEYVPEPMMSWWEADPYVEWEYNYTLRSISDANGSDPLGEGSIGSKSQIAKSYTFDASDVDDYTKSIAVAFVFDTFAGEIINAAQSPITTNTASVDKIAISTPAYSLTNGILTIENEADVNIFDISGRKVLTETNTTGVDLTSLKSGIYVIDINSQGKRISIKVAL